MPAVGCTDLSRAAVTVSPAVVAAADIDWDSSAAVESCVYDTLRLHTSGISMGQLALLLAGVNDGINSSRMAAAIVTGADRQRAVRVALQTLSEQMSTYKVGDLYFSV